METSGRADSRDAAAHPGPEPEAAGLPRPVVSLRGITKTYPGAARRVNDRISLDLMQAEILCLAGENGAGKTTLMKILYGVEQPTEGEILVRGGRVNIPSPLAANRLGIGMVYQHFMLFPELTAAQNVVMGIEPRRWGIFYDQRKARNAVKAIIDAHHFSLEADTPVKDLTVGQKQQVEILKLLYRNADILILDEPTAVLTRQETVSLFTTLRALKSAGKSIILITHKLPEITELADRVAVMRRGVLAGLRGTGEIDGQAISRLMIGGGEPALGADSPGADPGLGTAPGAAFNAAPAVTPGGPGTAPGAMSGTVSGAAAPGVPTTASTIVPPATPAPAPGAAGGSESPRASGGVPGEPVLRFDQVTVRRRGQKQLLLDRLSFTVREGEILGFAGVGGNGLGVLEALLGGFLPLASGAVYHRGRDISRHRSGDLRREGLAYVPADRLRVGSAPGATVGENLILNRRREFAPHFFLDTGRARRFAADLIGRFRISGGEDQILGTLSGGNIQKLILAREIEQFRDYIVFSEPSWGLDITAAAAVYREIRRLRDRGAAVLLISTNLEEILSLADRIIVLYRGSAAAELRGTGGIPDIKERIGAYMLGNVYTGADAGENAGENP